MDVLHTADIAGHLLFCVGKDTLALIPLSLILFLYHLLYMYKTFQHCKTT